jgi:hypothetical protein
MRVKLIIVIHILNENNIKLEDRTLREVTKSFDNGADGVMLTTGEAGITVDELLKVYRHVRLSFKKEFIAVNFMCNSRIAASNVPLDCDALWIDKGLGYTNHYDSVLEVKEILRERNWKGLYFGGFCMKGNNQSLFENKKKFEEYTWEPEKYFDVCVTSGISTGIGIEPDLLSIVKRKSNGVPLALASGVNIKNIDLYLDFVDYLIVGTGVEKMSTDSSIIEFYKSAGLPEPVEVGLLDEEKIKLMADRVHFFNVEQI